MRPRAVFKYSASDRARHPDAPKPRQACSQNIKSTREPFFSVDSFLINCEPFARENASMTSRPGEERGTNAVEVAQIRGERANKLLQLQISWESERRAGHEGKLNILHKYGAETLT